MSISKEQRHLFQWQLLKPVYWFGWLLIPLTVIVSILPWKFRKVAAVGVGLLFYRLGRSRRHIAEVNIERCLSPTRREKEQMVRRHFLSLGTAIIEECFLVWRSRSKMLGRLDIENSTGLEHYDAVRDSGVLLLSPHYTYLDLLTCLSAILPLTAATRHHSNALYNWLNHRARERYTERNLNPRNPFAISEALKDGDKLLHFPDQDPGARGSVYAPFFGHEVATNATYRMAAVRAKARVLFIEAWLHPETGKVRLAIEPFDEYIQTADKVEAATLVNRRLEKAIHHNVEHWLWCHKRFKTQRDGSRIYVQ